MKKFTFWAALIAIPVAIALAAGSTSVVISKPDGLHIGTKAGDKVCFYDCGTAIAQQANTVSAWTALQALHIIAPGGTDPGLTGNSTISGNKAFSGTNTFTGTNTFNNGSLIEKAGTGSATFLPSGRLYSTGTAVNTGANTTETDGATYTVPANTLSANNQVLRFRVFGTTGATGNNKTVQLYWGGTSVFTTGAVAANAKPWFLNLTIVRTGAGAQTVVVEGQFNAAAVAAVTTATKDETTALIVKNTMTNGTAAASDATTSSAMLEYLP